MGEKGMGIYLTFLSGWCSSVDWPLPKACRGRLVKKESLRKFIKGNFLL